MNIPRIYLYPTNTSNKTVFRSYVNTYSIHSFLSYDHLLALVSIGLECVCVTSRLDPKMQTINTHIINDSLAVNGIYYIIPYCIIPYYTIPYYIIPFYSSQLFRLSLWQVVK